ncbi:MAG: copper ion binding protein, partial [Sphaerospermopsis sp. SIO1G2]|nr:copper ion binding protein [Sphaerospermopsis sp. SIO1G2]
MTTQQLTFPVIGMTCANCVKAVERNSKKVEGVTEAVVNFASEKVTVSFDPAVQKGQAISKDVMARVARAGFEIPQGDVELPLLGMTCANCANTIQRRLNKLDGVLEATVNFASEKAAVSYVPGAVSRSEMVAAVRKAGFDVVETAVDESMEDAETAARLAEFQHQQHRFWVGLICSSQTTAMR